MPELQARGDPSATAFRRLAETVAEIVWTADAQGAWDYVNPPWEAATGQPARSALGQGWRKAVHPDDRALLLPPAAATASRAVSFRLRGADGAYARYRGRLSPAPEPDEQGRWLGTARAEAPHGRLADAMPHLVWIADERGEVEYYNSRAAEYDGIVQRGDGTWSWQPIVHPDEVEVTTRAWRRAVEAGTPYACEHRVRLADGTYRWHLSRAFPAQDPDGLRWYGTATDIHELKTAEEALRITEERNRLVARATNDAIWDWDLRTDRLYWNEAVLRHFGISPEELGPTVDAWKERIHPDDRERVLRGLREAVDGGGHEWSGEYRFRREDGTYRSFLDRGYVARDADGRPTRMIGSMLDLTEQREVQEALRESELFHRQTLDSIPGMVFTNRPDGSCEFVTEQWVEFTGVGAEALLGDGWIDVLHPDDRPRSVAAWQAAVEGETTFDVEYRVRRRDGVYEWFKVRGRPIRDGAGRIVRWFGTATNIHDLKMAEETLREADRRKDDFLAMLAHELRNPLAPVGNAVQILRRIGPGGRQFERVQDVLERQVAHMARLVDDLLDVSRIARGRIQLRREREDVCRIVRQTAEDYRSNLQADQVSLTVEAPAEPVWVEGDRTRLAQIIGNLLHNVGKFTDPGGRVDVRVEVEEPARAVTVTVADTGMGIEPRLMGRLFDPFAQAEQDLGRSKGGLGLGLPLVKGLVELHGGSIEAHSDGLGRGATFTIRLPLSPAPDARADAPGAAGSAPLTVVVIEDNLDAAETLQMVLTLSGHRALVAHDGRTGIEMVRAERPDVVICDIGLPGGTDGYAVARALRADPTLRPLLLVALSGYSQDEDRRRSQGAGFDVHLSKPVDLDTLDGVLGGVRRAPPAHPV